MTDKNMNAEVKKIAQMLMGISSDLLTGKIEEDVFKVQIEFANEALNKEDQTGLDETERTWRVDEIIDQLRPYESARSAATWFDKYGR